MKHYSEADLLETYYTQPGESLPVMMHLAECTDCAAKYDRLERKLREAAACSTDTQPETFWQRQRFSIMRRVRNEQQLNVRTGRYAAAAMLAFLLGGAVVYETLKPARATQVVTVPPTQTSAAAVVNEEPSVPRDPWQSEELKDFHQVVEWESWVAENPKQKTGESKL
jgi:predicted anti-sigma-YlaC factor YlaD